MWTKTRKVVIVTKKKRVAVANSVLVLMEKGEMKPMSPTMRVLAVALPIMSPKANWRWCFLTARRRRVISGRLVPRERRSRPMKKGGTFTAVAKKRVDLTKKLEETTRTANEARA